MTGKAEVNIRKQVLGLVRFAGFFAAAFLIFCGNKNGIVAHAETMTGKVMNTAESDTLTWSYDTETKAVVITGTGTRTEDPALENRKSFLGSTDNLEEVKSIRFTDCEIKGSMAHFFAEYAPAGKRWIGMTRLETIDFSGLKTSDVTDMSGMLEGCSRVSNLDLSSFDTSKVTNMSYMFGDCSSLKEVNLGSFRTQAVTNMSYMFRGCTRLQSLDLSNFDTGNVTDISFIFRGCSNMESLTVNNWNTGNVTKMDSVFSGCSSLKSLEVKDWNTGKVKSMDSIFMDCAKLTGLDVKGWDTRNVTDMGLAFGGCASMTDIDISTWKTGKVTDMNAMFSGCGSLKSLKLGAIDMGKVTDISKMFSGCSSLKELNVNQLNTNAVTNMEAVFKDCRGLTVLEVNNWKTRGVTNMKSTFSGCSNLSELDLSTWNAGDVTNMAGMFDGCGNLELLKAPKYIGESAVANLPKKFTDESGNPYNKLNSKCAALTLHAEMTNNDNGWRKEPDQDGKLQRYWYENGVKQGTEGRGKEIYDPQSDAWYWLDAVQGGTIATNKDVYQESNGGKWVRYDEDGKMVKGEDLRNDAYYYFEEITGTMIKGFYILPVGRRVYYDPVTGQRAKGDVYIDGVRYTFDGTNGALKGINGEPAGDDAGDKMWLTIAGRKYWYENWVRQGWNPADGSYRGKEIFDPASNAWYWLDNVTQGSMAVSKDVYQESLAGPWGAREGEDGQKYGKWVRYDAEGHMVKGWCAGKGADATVIEGPDKADGRIVYYFDLIYGTMAKGKVEIDGQSYEFDPITGIMK